MLKVSELHNQANARLEQTANPKRLALIHTAIALGVSFLLTIVTYLLSLEIANTGGLGGLGARSMLSTAQATLELVVMLALPFWQLGIFYAALRWERGESAEFPDLLQGFRRLGAALGLLVLRCILFISLGVIVANISTFLFMMTPFAEPMMEIFEPLMAQSLTPEQLTELLTPELMASITRASIPFFIMAGVFFLIVAIPVFYRTRFADFALMEGQTAGRALVKSFVITKGSCLQVLKIDLSFWWFYVLQMLSVAICNADLLLTYLGVSLPVSGIAATLLCYGLGSICQILLLWQLEAKRVTVYACAFRTLDGTLDTENAPEAE